MIKHLFAVVLHVFLLTESFASAPDYLLYHQQISRAEDLIAERSFSEALAVYGQVFSTYQHIFLRDCKVAAQLAFFLKDEQKAFKYLRKAIEHGWDLKSIKKNTFLSPLRETSEWKLVKEQYDSLRGLYIRRLNSTLRVEVHSMFKKDQRKAMGALFTPGPSAQDRYAEKRFAPNNEKQVVRLTEITLQLGYPGEKLVGSDLWAMTILSHHNSISEAYCRQDTMYVYLQPHLLAAIRKGEMSPFEYALVDNWFITVGSGHSQRSYGYLDPLTATEAAQANELRAMIGLRKVETRNRLIDIQNETGIDFYLPGWPGKNRKIEILRQE